MRQSRQSSVVVDVDRWHRQNDDAAVGVDVDGHRVDLWVKHVA